MLRRNELESWVERQSNDSEFQTEGALTLKAFADNASAVWGTGRRLRHSYISHTSWYTLHKIYYKPHHIRCNPFNIISSIQLIKTVNALQIKISIYEILVRWLLYTDIGDNGCLNGIFVVDPAVGTRQAPSDGAVHSVWVAVVHQLVPDNETLLGAQRWLIRQLRVRGIWQLQQTNNTYVNPY